MLPSSATKRKKSIMFIWNWITQYKFQYAVISWRIYPMPHYLLKGNVCVISLSKDNAGSCRPRTRSSKRPAQSYKKYTLGIYFPKRWISLLHYLACLFSPNRSATSLPPKEMKNILSINSYYHYFVLITVLVHAIHSLSIFLALHAHSWTACQLGLWNGSCWNRQCNCRWWSM